ncbi:MAG: hypothetical protein U5K33_09170 [Halofilum sp. (in: g-proteobacteria)]|nr:hypothetical protein [Halofilum sp. (in: g-proteobacteria)]
MAAHVSGRTRSPSTNRPSSTANGTDSCMPMTIGETTEVIRRAPYMVAYTPTPIARQNPSSGSRWSGRGMARRHSGSSAIASSVLRSVAKANGGKCPTASLPTG